MGTVVTTALALFFRLPDATVDLTSWHHWRLPTIENVALTADEDPGPVLVTVEYEVAPLMPARNQCVEYQPGDHELQQHLCQPADARGPSAHPKWTIHTGAVATVGRGGAGRGTSSAGTSQPYLAACLRFKRQVVSRDSGKAHAANQCRLL